MSWRKNPDLVKFSNMIWQQLNSASIVDDSSTSVFFGSCIDSNVFTVPFNFKIYKLLSYT